MAVALTYLSVGFIGLGKLGLPCAAAISVKTKNTVHGYDIDPRVKSYIETAQIPYVENRAEDFLKSARIVCHDSIEAVVEHSDLIFVAVQTPHQERFEGITPVPDDTEDFDYTFLCEAIESVADAVRNLPTKRVTIVVISTVLPGTMRNHVFPLLQGLEDQISFCYNPFFIAMGNTIDDFLDPEFSLIGSDNREAAEALAGFYRNIHDAPSRLMQIESAELTKVAYNTFIGFKIAFANTLGEIVDARGGNVDEVTSALSAATDRLISGRYLSAGMSDGGGCHPRDQIAMSWLANNANLSFDIFGFLAHARDNFTKQQANHLVETSRASLLPICLLGLSYKKNIGLTVGSPAVLLSQFLLARGVEYCEFDPFVFPDSKMPEEPHVFFVGTNHDLFREISFPSGSVVIDPWGNVIPDSKNLTVVRPGRG